MPPHTLASLAYALSAAANSDAAFSVLAEELADLDRGAHIALLRLDAKSGLLRERLMAEQGTFVRAPMEMSIDQFPEAVRRSIAAGGALADLATESPEFARMLGLPSLRDGGFLSVRGLRMDGQLSALLALLEPQVGFGTRVSERFDPMVTLFELAYVRFAEQDVRKEAVQTLEEVTQRVHGEYLSRLGTLEDELREARSVVRPDGTTAASDALARARETARVAEEARRSARRFTALEHQLTAAIGELEAAHIELHRRSEALRQRTRTTYLIERVLQLASGREEPRLVAEGLLALLADDMQAMRCSLFLAMPGEPGILYLAAARGLAPHITEGSRIKVGQGVAGRVAETREPLLVVDAADIEPKHLLGDAYFTTGSFISFPLIVHGELLGVVNLTNRAQRGLFVEEDVERVRLLGLVIGLIANEASLPERLLKENGGR